MDVTTINIASKESIDLVCSKCGCTRQIVVSKLPNTGKVYRVKCKCTHDFPIVFDRRKYKRKNVSLTATYSLEHGFGDNIAEIIDLSRGGLAFIRTDKNILNIGDRITIRFYLDNSKNDMIESTALIRNIFDNRVCVEFLDMRCGMQKTLGFYFF